jgi:hypothetical protein
LGEEVIITAIDPGPERSAFVTWATGDRVDGPPRIVNHDFLGNEDLRETLSTNRGGTLVIEMIASYGMAVGAEVFETVFWIGRFFERWIGQRDRMFRRDVKLNLCGDTRAKDANIRQAIIDRFGGKERAIGKKATPGPLYGIKGDEWSALAVALTYADRLKKPSADRPPF